MSHAVDLALRVEVDPTVVRVHYGVKNRETRVVYLLNLLHHGGPESIDPQLCYVDFEVAKRTVVVSKRVPDLPTDRHVYEPVAPYVTRIASGGEFGETLSLALPIRERHEYSPRGRPPLAHQEYDALRLRLGYYFVPPGTREDVEDVAGRRIVLPKVPPGTRPEFGELRAQQSGLILPVIAPATPS